MGRGVVERFWLWLCWNDETRMARQWDMGLEDRAERMADYLGYLSTYLGVRGSEGAGVRETVSYSRSLS